MFDYITILLTITAIANAGLATFIYKVDKKSPINRSFTVFTVFLSFWALSIIFFQYTADETAAIYFMKLAYISASIIAASFYYFTIVFPEDKRPTRGQTIFVVTLSVVLVALLLIPDFLTKEIFYDSWGKGVRLGLPEFIIFSIYFVGLQFSGLYRGWKKYTQTKGVAHVQLLYVIVSVAAASVLGTYFNLILPAPFFENFQWIWTGPLFTTIIVVAITYAIIKHHLFDVKVIATEIFTTLLWVFLFIRTVLSVGIEEYIINGTILLLTIVVGIFLIRSVVKEVENRERLEKLTGDLKVANQQLKKLDSQKSQMLSIASHQFRAPLTAIKGYASLVTEGSYGEVKDSIRESVERIATSAENLDHVVNDFLNVSRIDQGRMDYDFTKKDLRKIVSSVYEEAEVTASKADLKLTFLDDGSDNYIARADEGKLRQVIVNLVDNAIKYTLEGGEIRIIIARTDKPKKLKDITSDVIRISVEDDGIGIEKGTEEAIFEQFSRADGANDVNVIGTGLGLFVAQEIIQAHGGRIWAESKGKGKGSTFFVELPAAA